MARSQLAEYAQDPDSLKRIQRERLLIDVASLIYRTMKEAGVTRKELADAVGVTKGRITQYLGGERNLTLGTVADIFTALNSTIVVDAKCLTLEAEEWQQIDEFSDIITKQPSLHVWEQESEDDSTPLSLAS